VANIAFYIASEIVTALLEGFGGQLQNIIAIASSACDSS